MVRLSSNASPLQQRLNALTHEDSQVEDVLILRSRQLVKLRTAMLADGVKAGEYHTVEMHICIQGIPETLHKRHGATLRGAKTHQFLSAPPQFSKQSAYENVQDIAGEARIVGHAVAQRE